MHRKILYTVPDFHYCLLVTLLDGHVTRTRVSATGWKIPEWLMLDFDRAKPSSHSISHRHDTAGSPAEALECKDQNRVLNLQDKTHKV
ncbi:hypothetical protein VHEMI06863 [[Torrubiella] hemipterigena]|uniref:Uncharacterized protein n=1 Tax=[Torrubiella] hemipterigena TaxID=1531966 RepID=A0A0A1TK56_9HYPO|nr:hypothetical protein VHEMI06863 [[Torrubiella] hemipterigena]